MECSFDMKQTFCLLSLGPLPCMDAFEAGAPPEPEPSGIGAPTGGTALLPLPETFEDAVWTACP